MEYTKPVIVAENNESGSFAAGCPTNQGCTGGSVANSSKCKPCLVPN
jgi:hypothetical protein